MAKSKPVSIRYNLDQMTSAMQLLNTSTVQETIDKLLFMAAYPVKPEDFKQDKQELKPAIKSVKQQNINKLAEIGAQAPASKPIEHTFTQQQAKDLVKMGLSRHPLYKDGDPRENTPAFYMKYDCLNYEELENK